MFEVLKEVFQFGLEGGAAAEASTWPLVIATALIAATILRRQSDD